MPTKLCWHSCWLCELSWAELLGQPNQRNKTLGKGERKRQKRKTKQPIESKPLSKEAPNSKRRKVEEKKNKNIQISHGQLEIVLRCRWRKFWRLKKIIFYQTSVGRRGTSHRLTIFEFGTALAVDTSQSGRCGWKHDHHHQEDGQHP